MPRPRKNPDELLIREIRITPPNQKPIEDWHITDVIQKLVCFEEGTDDKKLHYHGIIHTTMTSQSLAKWIYEVAGCKDTGEKGNAVFFTRATHEGSQGYISKNKKLVVRHGELQTTIEEWFKESDDYNRQRETDRKRKSRTRDDELAKIIELAKSDLNDNHLLRNVECIVDTILKHCHHSNIRFPPRSQMEAMVIKLLYPYNPVMCQLYYSRSFPNNNF